MDNSIFKPGQGWRVRFCQKGIYTGGKLEFSCDGRFFACSMNDNVAIVNTRSGRLSFTLRPESEISENNEVVSGLEGLEKFTSFSLHPNGRQLISASENQLIRHWDLGSLLDKKFSDPENSLKGF